MILKDLPEFNSDVTPNLSPEEQRRIYYLVRNSLYRLLVAETAGVNTVFRLAKSLAFIWQSSLFPADQFLDKSISDNCPRYSALGSNETLLKDLCTRAARRGVSYLTHREEKIIDFRKGIAISAIKGAEIFHHNSSFPEWARGVAIQGSAGNYLFYRASSIYKDYGRLRWATPIGTVNALHHT